MGVPINKEIGPFGTQFCGRVVDVQLDTGIRCERPQRFSRRQQLQHYSGSQWDMYCTPPLVGLAP